MKLNVKAIENQIKDIDIQIKMLKDSKSLLYAKLVNLKIKPFKLGDHVLYEVPRGRNKKWCECILEFESEVEAIYARPIKNDGTLDNRHFYISSLYNKENFDKYIKPLEES